MYRLRLLSFFSFFIFVVSFPSRSLASDTVVNEFSAMLPSNCIFSGDFQQEKTVPMLEKALTSHGKLVYHCEKGLVWALASPIEQTVVYAVQGDSYMFSNAAEPEKLKGRVHRELGKLLNNLVGGDISYLTKHFTIGRDKGRVFTLKPQKKRMAKFIAGIRFDLKNIDSEDEQSMNIHVMKTDGEHLNMTIFNVKTMTSLNASSCAQLDTVVHSSCRFLVDR